MGLFGILFYRLLDNLHIIMASEQNFFTFLLYIAVIMNLFISFVFVCMAPILIYDEDIQERRIVSRFNKRFSRLIEIPIAIFLFLLGANNLYIAFRSGEPSLNSWPFFVFGVFFIVQSMGSYTSKLLIRKNIKNKKTEMPEIPLAPFSVPETQKKAGLIVIIAGLALSIISLAFLKSLAKENLIISNIVLIKSSIEFIIMCVVFLVGILQFVKKTKFNWLEKLERKIVIEQLSAEEIRSIFVKEYLGEKALDWIKSIQNELNRRFDELLRLHEDAEKQFVEIGRIETNYKFEIEGRTNQVERTIVDKHKEYNQYSKQVIEQITALKRQSPFNSEESLVLDVINNEWKNQLDQINSMFNNFSEKFQKIIGSRARSES